MVARDPTTPSPREPDRRLVQQLPDIDPSTTAPPEPYQETRHIQAELGDLRRVLHGLDGPAERGCGGHSE